MNRMKHQQRPGKKKKTARPKERSKITLNDWVKRTEGAMFRVCGKKA